ncbi:MAG: NAD-dependent succinate-semialdehyde dehydrogenase [Deltaproteobacteria bacterium]|nr:NAD-dependent succinate-semialdehyde dehydrogenase [Candidatus Anaeroferrophillacea bacterium]
MKSVNPATNEMIREYREHTDAEVWAAIERGQAAFTAWRNTGFDERRRLLLAAGRVVREELEQHARTITMEMGKTITESRAEVEKCARVCEFYADHAAAWLADELVETDAEKSFVAYEPLGLVLAVMPWNFPFWQVFRFAAPALMAGNGGVLKHASNVPGSALAIAGIFRRAGFPPDLFNTLLIGASRVEAVIANPLIRAVTITGSEVAGSRVAAAAGREIKKTVMELGGSDPFIVLEDADLPDCVAVSAAARMVNAGQTCIAAKRFIVVASRAEEFAERQAQVMGAMKVGDPLDPATQAGPLARADLVEDLHHQVTASIAAGARLLTGGRRLEGPGFFYAPTVLADVRPGMPVYHEETFGPVSAIIPVRDEEEAVRVANDSEYGLGASLWTRDLERGERLARRIESGAVFVNGMTRSDPRMPFGGIKKSGYGRELSYHGIREFVNIKTVSIGSR